MPCRDYTDWEIQRDQAETIKFMRGRLDYLTQLLCDVCEKYPPVPGTARALWWEQHQENDRKAKEEAEARRAEQERRNQILKENEERSERQQLARLLAKYGGK